MRLLGILFFIWAAICLADAKDEKASSSEKSTGSNSRYNSVISTIDDRVFDGVGANHRAPKNQVSPKGNTLYPAPQARYNTEQRENALKVCEPEKDFGMSAFRKCYQEELAKASNEVEQRINAVEKQQLQPLRNRPLPSNQERQPNSPLIEVEKIYENN